MLDVQSLACRRGKRLVFRDLGFTLKAGGILLVTGRNGSGKSSLLRALAGLLPVCAGDMRWQDEPVRDFTAHRARLTYIGHLDALKPELTAAETINYWRALRGQGKRDCLEPFGLAHLRDKPVRHFSAGQKRRLTLARLVMDKTPLWLLDEPSTALDATGQELLNQLIMQHRAKGGIAIMATHQKPDFENVQSLTLGASA